MIDRRQFLQLIGATGAAFYLPAPAPVARAAEGVVEPEPNCVTLTIEGLSEDTRYAILDMHGNLICDGKVTDAHEGRVEFQVEPALQNQHLKLRAISPGHLFVECGAFVADQDAKMHVIQTIDRNYIPS